MKRFFLTLLIFSVLWPATAQKDDKDKNWEQIKALKTAFITQEMQLSDKEAQQFWPVYNTYEEKRSELRHREHEDLNLECLTGDKAEAKLQEYLDIEKEEYLIKKEYFSELRKIFPAEEIVKLMKLEDDFHKKLFNEYRSRKSESGTKK